MENTNICQEKSYTELKKKFVQCEEQETLDIIKSTPTESKKENLSGISYTRNCPKCNKLLKYKTKFSLQRSTLNESLCKKCSDIGNIDKNEIFSRNCPKCNKLLKYSLKGNRKQANEYNKICKSCRRGLDQKGKIRKIYTQEDFQRICPKCKHIIVHKNIWKRNRAQKLNKICKKCSSSSTETKLKHRISILKFIQEKHGGIRPMINPNACKIIDDYGKQNGLNFQHALNGGEYHIKDLGYFVDGYDKEKNVVFEYDEKHHYTKNGLKDEDIQRMGEIKQHLQCKFLRFNEKLNEIKEY